MCKQTDAEIKASTDLTIRGKRLRVHAFMCYDTPLNPDDLFDEEVSRLLGAYEIPALTLALRLALRPAA